MGQIGAAVLLASLAVAWPGSATGAPSEVPGAATAFESWPTIPPPYPRSGNTALRLSIDWTGVAKASGSTLIVGGLVMPASLALAGAFDREKGLSSLELAGFGLVTGIAVPLIVGPIGVGASLTARGELRRDGYRVSSIPGAIAWVLVPVSAYLALATVLGYTDRTNHAPMFALAASGIASGTALHLQVRANRRAR